VTLFVKFFRVSVRTAPGNFRVELKVRSFNCFGAIGKNLTFNVHCAQTDTHRDKFDENIISTVHCVHLVEMVNE